MDPMIDIMTTAKNVATAINQLGQSFLHSVGRFRSDPITNNPGIVVSSASGSLVLVSVTAASGTATADVYDSNKEGVLTNKIAAVKPEIGVQNFGIPYTTGLVIVAPSTVTLVVVYSEDPKQ